MLCIWRGKSIPTLFFIIIIILNPPMYRTKKKKKLPFQLISSQAKDQIHATAATQATTLTMPDP